MQYPLIGRILGGWSVLPRDEERRLPRDARVLIPGFTFAAVPSSVVHADCVPVLCEVGENYRIDMADFKARLDDVQAVIDCDEGRFGPEHHEYALIAGLLRVFDRLASPGVGVRRAPDGWILMELFKEFVGSVARFRDHYVRQDSPWDAILYVEYPDSSQLNAYLDGFNVDSSYMDNRMRFEKLHPVRQAFRVMWHFARIALAK